MPHARANVGKTLQAIFAQVRWSTMAGLGFVMIQIIMTSWLSIEEFQESGAIPNVGNYAIATNVFWRQIDIDVSFCSRYEYPDEVYFGIRSDEPFIPQRPALYPLRPNWHNARPLERFGLKDVIRTDIEEGAIVCGTVIEFGYPVVIASAQVWYYKERPALCCGVNSSIHFDTRSKRGIVQVAPYRLSVHYWRLSLLVLGGVAIEILARQIAARVFRLILAKTGRCPACQYPQTGIVGKICPECGTGHAASDVSGT